MCYCVRQDAPRAAAVAAVAAMDVLASCPEPPSTESENALRSRLQLLQQCSARCEACGRLEDEQGDLMLLCDGCLRAGYHQYALLVLSHELVSSELTHHTLCMPGFVSTHPRRRRRVSGSARAADEP